MKKTVILFAVLLAAVTLNAQIKVVSIEKATLPEEIKSYQAKFSPDGKSIFFSNSDYDGIWKYSISGKTVSIITNDKFSGYGFDIDETGTKIAYRRSAFNNGYRTQEIIEKDIPSNKLNVIEKGENISTPLYSSGRILYSKNRAALNIASLNQNNEIKILGIENTKISILRNGKKEILDPLGNGSYIWPSLSPDGSMIIAHDISKGTFICNTEGKVITMLGKRNSPCFTRDGKWIVYMKDRDDGHQIITSDIFCVSIDGKQTVQLTKTDNQIELNPVCSSKDNKIAFTSLNGDLYIMSYEEVK